MTGVRAGRALVAVVSTLLVLAPALPAAPASATAYRYWTYWTGTGATWTFAQMGPASTVPEHGDVEGWRFAVSTGTRGQGAAPRISPGDAFDRFCDPGPPPEGAKRVAIVFDFGTASDAPPDQSPPEPRGTCVETDESATGGEVLAEAADVRVEGGLVCAIGGYPRGECAPAVAPTAEPTPTPKQRRNPPREDSTPQTKGQPEPQPREAEDPQDSGNTAPPADPTAKPKRTPSRSPTPTPTGAPTATAAPAQASPTPEFVAEDARLADEPAGQWGLLAAALALAALGGVAVWRLRQRRR